MSIERYSDEDVSMYLLSQPTLDDPVLIECPKCAQRASIVPTVAGVKASCLNCVMVEEKMRSEFPPFVDNGGGRDPYFGHPLWIRTEVCGHLFWAYRKAHLAELEAFISSKLRERTVERTSWRNKSFSSRLPAWMKDRKNRAALLAAIEKLKRDVELK